MPHKLSRYKHINLNLWNTSTAYLHFGYCWPRVNKLSGVYHPCHVKCWFPYEIPHLIDVFIAIQDLRFTTESYGQMWSMYLSMQHKTTSIVLHIYLLCDQSSANRPEVLRSPQKTKAPPKGEINRRRTPFYQPSLLFLNSLSRQRKKCVVMCLGCLYRGRQIRTNSS